MRVDKPLPEVGTDTTSYTLETKTFHGNRQRIQAANFVLQVEKDRTRKIGRLKCPPLRLRDARGPGLLTKHRVNGQRATALSQGVPNDHQFGVWKRNCTHGKPSSVRRVGNKGTGQEGASAAS